MKEVAVRKTSRKNIVQVFRSVDSSIATVARVISQGIGHADAQSTALILGDGDVKLLSDSFDSVESLGLNIECWKGLRVKLFIKLLKMVRRSSANIYIGHRYKEFIMLLLIQRLFGGFKLVIVFHGERDLRNWSRRWFFTRLLNKNCSLVAVSESVKDYVIAKLPHIEAERVEVINNGVDFEEIASQALSKAEARAQLGLDQNAVVFGSMGRLAHTKGTDLLVEAFAKLSTHNNGPLLVLMGDGATRVHLKLIAERLGVGDRVVFLGKLDRGAKYLKAFDFFVFPSRREGFGLALVEAIAAKVPVIYSNIAVFKTIAINHGNSVEVGNVDLLAKKMGGLSEADHRENESVADELYEYAVGQFSIDVTVEKYKRFLIGCLN